MRKVWLPCDEEVYFSLYRVDEYYGVVVFTRLGLYEITLPSASSKDEVLATLHKHYTRPVGENDLARDVAKKLIRYFSGEMVDFDDLLDTRGNTAFQNQVYWAVRTIRYGEVKTYGEIAREIHRPKAARGVGSAMARNALPIIIPCHRVIGSSGAMTGYSAPGGTERKLTLLRMEAEVLEKHKGIKAMK